MAYDPRTGITTYDDPTMLDTSASDPAPSTATSFPSAMTDTKTPTMAPAAPTAPTLPEGWSTVAPEGWGDQSIFNLTGPTDLSPVPIPFGRGGTPSRAGPQPVSYGTANPQGLINNGFYNVTDYIRGQIGGADIAPLFYNPQTGLWAAMSGRGLYTIQDQPRLTQTVPNQSSLGGMFQEAWGNGFGMAMAPFLAGFGGGVSGSEAGGVTEAGAGGAMDMGGSAGVFDSFGNPLYSSPGMLPSLTQLGTNFGTNLLNSGGDVKSALKNTAVNTGIGAGANFAADTINTTFAPTNTPSRFGEDVMYAQPTDVGDPTKRMLLADSGGMLDTGLPLWAQQGIAGQENVQTLQQALGIEPYTPPSTPLIDPSSAQTIGGIGVQKALEARSQGMLPASSSSPLPLSDLDATAQHQTLRQALGVEPSTPPSTEGAAPAADTAPAPSPDVVSAHQIESLAKINSALAQLHQGRGTPEDAPQRQEGQTDEQYSQTLTDYLNSDPRTAIDPQVLSDAGITPGTPEYYQFVMSQLDSVIGQITDGLDPNSPDLAAQLRVKSREELDALERALYVRGQLGQLMGSGQYTDPFTGISEDVNTGGAQVNPSLAAYHRGLHRSAEALSGMNPVEARQYVGGMLDRNPDLFGAQAHQNARTLDEILSQQNMDPEDIKRRRGMFAQDPFANLGTMSERDLEATLASLLH